MKIGYLGPASTFTDWAATQLFPNGEKTPYRTIPECMKAVAQNKVSRAVVPLENTLEGSVNITLDYLIHEYDLIISAEITVPIRQQLMVHPDHAGKRIQLETIYSHSHAIAQCHKFLHKFYPDAEYEYTSSTSAAAKIIKENPGQRAAAIANELAAEEYGLSIIKRDIHDYSINHTRFIVLSSDREQLDLPHLSPSGFKTTLQVTLPSDQAGALHQVLSAFAWRKLNLSKIESRPMKTGLGNYFFIIDIEMGMDEVLIPGAIGELEALGCTVKALGSYPYFKAE